MHDDFYKMTGCMHAVSTYFRTRRRDGSRYTTTGPNRAVQSYAGKLDTIAGELLQIAFEMEAAENHFQKTWGAEKTNVFTAVDSLHRAAGAASSMPAAGLTRQRLGVTYGGAVTNPGDGASGHAFLDALRLAVQDTERAFHAGRRTPAMIGNFNVALLRLNGVLDILKAAQDSYDAAFSVMRSGLMGQADAFVRLYASLVSQVTPWSSMDERLRQLMAFMERSARAGIGAGPGDTSTPSWGGVATSGSSSSGSSSSAPSSSSGS